ncbi:MAG: type IVB secretion system protein IcmV [Gammaproteobacteria bacterium]
MEKTKKPQKKEKRGFVKGTYKTFFDVPSWFGYQQFKQNNSTIFSILKRSFSIAKPTHHESFEQAIARMGLSEKDLSERMKFNQKVIVAFMSLSIIALIYALYLAWGLHFKGALVAIAVTALLMIRAFQYSFWNFQIKHKHLGCTIKEWRAGKLEEPSSSSPSNQD